MKTQIIFLNGPSSSGKTLLAKELQETLTEPFLHISIDKMIGLMPEKLNDWEGGFKEQGFCFQKNSEGSYELHMGPFAKRISKSFKDVVRLLVNSGYKIIIDDIAFGDKELQEWRKTLHGIKALYIGVTAPIEVIEKREKARKYRLAGTGKTQALRTHEGASYDLMIDTHEQSLEENVRKILDRL